MERSVYRAPREPGKGCFPHILDDLAIQFAQRRAAVEDELLRVVLNEPRAGVSTAESLGVTPSYFGNDDFQIVYSAAADHRHDRTAVLLEAKRRLRDAHLWDASQIPANVGMRWSDASLADFANWFCSFPTAAMVTTTVRLLAPRLVELVRREAAARAHLRKLVGLINGQDHETPALRLAREAA